MKFSQFLLNEQIEQENALLIISKVIENNPNLPKPTKYLDGGSDAIVFDCENQNMVIRVGKKDCEFTMAEPILQKTGGVAKIYFITQFQFENESYVVDWKEKVDTNVYGFLIKLGKTDPQTAETIASILGNMYMSGREEINSLGNFAVTKPLRNALFAGLPKNDLDISQNLGINKKGIIVAYDC